MPTIAALTLYPIKSCAGISLQTAMVTAAGLSYAGIVDREWMVVDDDGQFLTQREHPKMALIRTSINNRKLVLYAPGIVPLEIPLDQPDPAHSATRQVQVWDDTLPASDCGEASATWLSALLGIACSLVRFHPSAQRFANPKWTGELAVPTLFSDGYPMLLISSASLEDLNQKLLAQGRHAVPMNRFRPNIVIDGIAAFEEDYAESLIIKKTTEAGSIGAMDQTICLKPVKPCPRCPIPAIDQVTAEVGPNPVDILQSYRANALLEGAVTFGMNTILTQGAGQYLSVGDEVELTLAF